MNNISINTISLKNFKGVPELCVDFGHRTVVLGANATGKTTLFDATNWCLFGKDSQDRTDSGRGAFSIKTVGQDGTVIERLDHEVTLLLSVNGYPLKVTRRLTEDWVKPRGCAETRLEGNTTHYLWNDVEVKKKDFDQRVSLCIADERKFKMMTNPHYFCNLPWEEQRAELNGIVGTVTFADIAGLDPLFEIELEKMNSLGVTDPNEYRKSIRASMNRLQKDVDEASIKIKGIREVTPTMPDLDALATEHAAIESELEAIEQSKGVSSEQQKELSLRIDTIHKSISALRSQQSSLVAMVLEEANREAAAHNERLNSIKRSLLDTQSELKREESQYRLTIETAERMIRLKEDAINNMYARKETLLKEWHECNDKTFPEGPELICPILCERCDSAKGMASYQEKQQEKKARFEEKVQRELQNIEQQGFDLKNQITLFSEEKARMEKELDSTKQESSSKIEALKAKEEELMQSMVGMDYLPTQEEVDTSLIPEYQELENQIKHFSLELDMLTGSQPKHDVEQDNHIFDLRHRLEVIAAEQGKVAVIKANDGKVAQLEAYISDTIQAKADLEREEDIIMGMNRAVADEMERRCAEAFLLVKFRMIDVQLNGGEVATCYATYKGVKYSDLNSAAQVNAGLDIINTLCRRYEVHVPIFIDNAEGINEVEDTESQMIQLVVSEDKPMKVIINER